MPVLTRPRATKQEARYTPAGGREKCADCRFFVLPNDCKRIIGPVSPRGWCKYFSQEAVAARRRPGGFVGGGGSEVDTTIDLNFLTMAPTLDPRVTFTRASTASYFGATGTMQTAASNVPRFAYDPNMLTALGLLLEESRTNLVIQSGFASGWAITGPATLTAGAATGPDGAASAASLLSTDATANVRQVNPPGATASASAAYTVSVFMRSSATPTNGYIQVNTASAAGQAYFDLTAGTAVVGSDLAGAFTAKSAQITRIGNFWRCQFSFTTPAGTASLTPYIGACQAFTASGDYRTYTGVAGQGIYLYGAQIEAGAFVTSYIPTTSASVTRAADTATLASIPGRNTSAETFAADFQANTAQNANSRVIADAASTKVMIYIAPGLQIGAHDGVAGVQTVNAFALGTVAKAASTWAAPNAASICLNGGAVAAVTTLTAGFASVATVRLMADSGGNQTNGYIRRFRYWPRAMSLGELGQVTS